jgi:hypothetical protein
LHRGQYPSTVFLSTLDLSTNDRRDQLQQGHLYFEPTNNNPRHNKASRLTQRNLEWRRILRSIDFMDIGHICGHDSISCGVALPSITVVSRCQCLE